jgi:hypothetical protein
MPDQQPAAEQRADARAERVQPVQRPDALGDALTRGCDGARQQREGRAHQRGGQNEAREAQREDRRRGIHHTRHVGRQPVVQEWLGEQRENADADLGEGEAGKRARRAEAVCDLRTDDGAEPEPGQERPDHQRRRDGVGPGEDAKHALPHDLAQQRRKSRREERDG